VHQLGVVAAHTKVDPRVAQDLKVLMSQEVYRYHFAFSSTIMGFMLSSINGAG
jgi:hypothetical protein